MDTKIAINAILSEKSSDSFLLTVRKYHFNQEDSISMVNMSFKSQEQQVEIIIENLLFRGFFNLFGGRFKNKTPRNNLHLVLLSTL